MLRFKDYCDKRVYSEVTDSAINKIASKLSKLNPQSLPFNNLFDDKYRLVIPFYSAAQTRRVKELEKKGYRVDLSKGMAIKKVVTQRGEKETAIRLGKVVQREFGPEALNDWESPYSIIVTRHPLDILKMSDWRHIRSCHSEGGSYWGCAIKEAKEGGLVAFLVNKRDLDAVGDLQAEEIFSDKDRDKQGITPVARLRIRHFSDGSDVQLAVPEDRVYGTASGSLQTSVITWLREAQKDVMQTRHMSGDMILMGGDYEDTDASKLFNNLYGDNEDTGTNSKIRIQYLRELRRYDKEYNNKWKNKNFIDAGWIEDDEPYGDEMFSWDGRVVFAFPASEFIVKFEDVRSQISRLIRNSISINDPGEIGGVDLEQEGDNWHVIVRIYDDDHHHPDDYKNFLRETMEDIDENYGIYRSNVNNGLIYNKVKIASEFLKRSTQWLDEHPEDVWKEKFQNFSISEDHWNANVIYLTSVPVNIAQIDHNTLFFREGGLGFGEYKDFQSLSGYVIEGIDSKPFAKLFDDYIAQVNSRIQRDYSGGWLFPDAAKIPSMEKAVKVKADLMIESREKKNVYLQIMMEVQEKHGWKAMEHTIRKLHILDRDFYTLMQRASEYLRTVVLPKLQRKTI